MTQTPRSTLIVANWKMYKTRADTEAFLGTLKPLVADSTAAVWIAVPFTSISVAKEQAADTAIVIGAQNMNDASEGAFTGEIAAKMLVDVGASFVLLGHSERRRLFHESDAFINCKVKSAISNGLRPLLCIGETQEERQAGDMEDVLATQLSQSLANIDMEALSTLVVAYEPVWAIGTGLNATAEQAQEAHAFCREYLAQHWGVEFSQAVSILYGGSAKPENAAILLRQPDIDGLLVGGASLDPKSFAAIIHSTPSPALEQAEVEIHET